MAETSRITRRDLLKIGMAPAAAMLAPRLLADEKKAAPRPNILFCIADDWSWPHAGIGKDPVVKTPTFDRIAREGVLLTNAYVAAPSCSHRTTRSASSRSGRIQIRRPCNFASAVGSGR